MGTPPTFAAEYESAWNVNTTPKTTSVTTAVGDTLVLIGSTADQLATLNTPTGGTGLTWTLQQSVVVANYCTVYVWTATATTAETFTCSVTRTGGTGLFWGFNCLKFTGSDGVGGSNKFNVPTTGTPSVNVTTTGDNSAIVALISDWSAIDGTAPLRTWLTINSTTPSIGAGTEPTYFRDSSQYTVYGGVWTDAGVAGPQTVGLSAPGGQKYSIAAVEVLGVADPPPVQDEGTKNASAMHAMMSGGR